MDIDTFFIVTLSEMNCFRYMHCNRSVVCVAPRIGLEWEVCI